MKFASLFNRTPDRSIPHELYGAVMAQSRLPVFFSDCGVADTVVGRADILGLHMVLLGRRLAGESAPSAQTLSQDVFDVYVDDLDRALRELGVGDTSVPKRKKALVHGYYGQVAALVPAIDAGDRAALGIAIAERFHGGNGVPATGVLAEYVLSAAAGLGAQSFNDISQGQLAWPEPAVPQAPGNDARMGEF
jgi:cytochrome b pre-mRNA-processing protein 3